MKCPIDQVALNMSDRRGIEIDYCPQCRGVWLDRGELDKIIERSENSASATAGSRESQTVSHQERQTYDWPPRVEQNYGYQKDFKKRKKESFLGDLFDF